MEKKYLIINTGSTSKKLALYESERELCMVHLESEGDGFISTLSKSGDKKQKTISKNQFEENIEYVLGEFLSEKIIEDKSEIQMIGLRIVAPGTYFQTNRVIDDTYKENLKKAETILPLHITPVLETLKHIGHIFSHIPVVGISDSKFHKDLPDMAKYYAIPKEDTEKFELFKYGYHGISHSSVIEKIKNMYDEIPERVILCHIGGGISITAVKNGKSIDTTMGFTPLSGAVMATRVGDIDPGAVIYLQKRLKMSGEESEQYFNKQSGLLGVSGLSSDLRELLKLEEKGNPFAKRAIDMFQYRIKKEIGSSIVVLGGVDMIVFSGTIGERSHILRERICEGLQGLGIILDRQENENIHSTDSEIGKTDSQVKIVVLRTEEMSCIAKETREIPLV
ncbi:MAG: acetate/propionate family kinase [bacterium]